MRRHLNYANVVATLALVFAMSGGALAASHYLITSTSQISPKVLKKLKGKTGKTGATGAAGATGAGGSTGPQGPVGKEGPPGPATGAAGGDLAGNYPNPSIRSGGVTPSKTSGFPGARVETKKAENVGNSAYVALSFEETEFNVGEVFSSGAPTKFTAPVTGVYIVTGSAEWESGGAGWRQLEILAGGNRVATELIPVAATQFTYNSVSMVVRLTAGEAVELKANQTSGGGSLNVNRGMFAMNWLGTGS